MTPTLPTIVLGSVTFGDERAREAFAEYVELLESNPEKFADGLATLRQLRASEVEYHVRIVSISEPGIGGRLTTDGRRVFVNLSLDPSHELGSINSRLAHELEHARQFDSGELAFLRDPATGTWHPSPASYDIGDEVKAWGAQLKAAARSDFWSSVEGRPRPSLLRLYAGARTDKERADVLARNGYRDRNLVADCNVVFENTSGYVARQVIRPSSDMHFFGRVYATMDTLAEVRKGFDSLEQIVTLN